MNVRPGSVGALNPGRQLEYAGSLYYLTRHGLHRAPALATAQEVVGRPNGTNLFDVGPSSAR